MDPWTFWIGGALTVGSGLMMISRRNAVASVMWLVSAFLGMALLFFGMDAAFIGVLQILVYVGAILVLFLFVIMLRNLTPSGLQRIDRPRLKVVGLASAFAFIGLIVGLVAQSEAWTTGGTAEAITQSRGGMIEGSVLGVANTLFDQHLLPFEMASILLLVAIIGSVVLSKRKL